MRRAWRPMGKTNKRTKGRQLWSIWSHYEVLNPFQNQRVWTLCSRMPFLISSRLSRWVLMLDQIIIFRDEKINFFKTSDFQRILISRKKTLKNIHPFQKPMCGNKSFQTRSFNPKLISHSEISSSDHQLCGNLKSK